MKEDKELKLEQMMVTKTGRQLQLILVLVVEEPKVEKAEKEVKLLLKVENLPKVKEKVRVREKARGARGVAEILGRTVSDAVLRSNELVLP